MLRVGDTAFTPSKRKVSKQNRIPNSSLSFAFMLKSRHMSYIYKVQNISELWILLHDLIQAEYSSAHTITLEYIFCNLCQHLHSWFLSEHIDGHIFTIWQALQTKIECLVSLHPSWNIMSAKALHGNGVKLLFEPQHLKVVKVDRSEVHSSELYVTPAKATILFKKCGRLQQ